MSARRHEIVIAGGGIVGAAAALALLRAGFDVALVERGAAAPAPAADIDARVYAIAPASRRFLRELGAWPSAAAAPYQRMRVWDADPAQALVFDAAEAALPELGHIVAHDQLHHALWQRLGSVALHLGETVQDFEADGGAVRLGLAGGQCIEAALVVAADGARSALRELAGIDTVGWPYPHEAIVCHLQSERPHRATALQRFLPEGPLAFLPLADGRSSLVWSTTRAAQRMALSDADFAAELHRLSQGSLGLIGAMTRRRAVPLQLLHARQYSAAGLALVGDAAHVVHPLAGQGLNLGLGDVAVLVEVLLESRRQRRGLGAPRVLSRYARRRKLAALEMMAVTDGLYRLFGRRGPALDPLRNLGLSLLDRLPPLKGPLLRRAVGL